MNLIDAFQDLVSRIPELLQPLIVALAGAVPMIEGEGSVTIGIMGGLHPVVAVMAAILGNFICVVLLVLLGSGARRAVVARSRRTASTATRAGSAAATPAPVPSHAGAVSAAGAAAPAPAAASATTAPAAPDASAAQDAPTAESHRAAARRAKFQRAFARYGVPGVSLLGPLLLPTQFTATMLAAIGVDKARILTWQAIAITGWTTIVAVLVSGVLSAAG